MPPHQVSITATADQLEGPATAGAIGAESSLQADIAAAPAPRVDRGAWATSLVAVAADALALAASAAVTLAVVSTFDPAPRPAMAQLAAFGAWVLFASATARLYPGAALSRVEELRRQVLLVTSAGLAFALSATVVSGTGYAAQPIVMAAMAMIALPGFRSLARRLARGAPWWGVPVVVLGTGASSARLITSLLANPEHGLRPVANIGVGPASGAGDDAPDLIAAHLSRWSSRGVRHAIVAAGDMPWEAVPAVMRTYGRHFPQVMILRGSGDLPTVGLHAVSVAGHVGVQMRHRLTERALRVVKRSLDLALLVPIAIAALPLVVLFAVWVWSSSRGSPFYFQEREGRDGRPFKVWKLRTMHQDAEELLERYLNENPAARTEWQSHYKLTTDPRILPGVGTLLRRTSLDELPQLWNIFRGEMSFVGPRPFPYYHLAAFDDEFRSLRRSVTPGLTGLWQVSVRSDGDTALQRQLDLSYVANWSIWLDLYVLARTPWAVLRGRGAR